MSKETANDIRLFGGSELGIGIIGLVGLFTHKGKIALEDYALTHEIPSPDWQTAMQMYSQDINLTLGTIVGIVIATACIGDGIRRLQNADKIVASRSKNSQK